MYKFEKLKVWHEILTLIKLVYDIINQLPNSERYGLADQLRRSVVSIALNLAEGCAANGDKEFRSFIRISIKSQYETVAGLKIIEGLFPQVNVKEALDQSEIVGKMLHGLLRSIKSND